MTSFLHPTQLFFPLRCLPHSLFESPSKSTSVHHGLGPLSFSSTHKLSLRIRRSAFLIGYTPVTSASAVPPTRKLLPHSIFIIPSVASSGKAALIQLCLTHPRHHLLAFITGITQHFHVFLIIIQFIVAGYDWYCIQRLPRWRKEALGQKEIGMIFAFQVFFFNDAVFG